MKDYFKEPGVPGPIAELLNDIQRAVAKPRCPACDDVIEVWWCYCAMCGWHLAGGERP